MLLGGHRTIRLSIIGTLLAILYVTLPSTAIADVTVVQNLLDQGKLQDALKAVDGDLKGASDDVTLRFLKGVILTRLNRLDDAARIFQDLISEHPELPEPYNNLAVIYAAEGKYEDARDALQKAIDTHPSYATAHENLGDIYAKMASQAYNHALQLNEDNASAKEKLALINNLFSLSHTAPATAAPAAPAKAATTAMAQAPGGEASVDTTAAVAQNAVKIPTAKEPSAQAAPAAEKPAAPPPQVAPEPGAPAVAAAKENVVAAAAEAPGTDTAAQDSDAAAAVRRTIDLWVSAWADKDVKAYLSHYAGNFDPGGGLSLARWKRIRSERVKEPAFIKINISDLHVEMLGAQSARATFVQDYQSDTYSDRVAKTLTMKNHGGNWLITDESTN